VSAGTVPARPDTYDFDGCDEMGLAVLATLDNARQMLAERLADNPDAQVAAVAVIDEMAAAAVETFREDDEQDGDGQ
jgi:hypothetical protein